MEELTKIQNLSNETFDFWKNKSNDWAPKQVIDKLEVARLDWLSDLTASLTIWEEKGLEMSDGELILAYANLGSLVEGWLKLLYCVHYMDYILKPRNNSKNKMIEPNELSFEHLKQYSRRNLWSIHSNHDLWVEKIQQRRNAIHSFNTRNIGKPKDFLDDLSTFLSFIIWIDGHLPYPDPYDYY